MSNINDVTDKPKKLKISLVFLAMIAINVGLAIWFSTGTTLTSDIGIVVIASMATVLTFLMFLHVYASAHIPNYGFIMAFCLAFTPIALVGFMDLTMETSISYYDDCQTLSEINPGVSIGNCVYYASENMDATGVEIIEALIPKSIPGTYEVLERPLIP